MDEIDRFASKLLEESRRFLEKAKDHANPDGEQPFLHAALMVGFSALEAHVNAIAEEMASHGMVTLHEKALLLEQDVRLEHGEFKIQPGLRVYRLDDRIEFLYRHFSHNPIDRAAGWWNPLMGAIRLRNELTHPKGVPTVTRANVESALQAIVDTLDALYRAIYKSPLPSVNQGVNSRLAF